MKCPIHLSYRATLFMTALVSSSACLLALPDSTPETSAISSAYVKLPLSFEANAGQTDPRVKYVARGSGYTIFLTANDVFLSLQDRQHGDAGIRLKLGGANRDSKIAALDELAGKSNYFIGNDPAKWRTDV